MYRSQGRVESLRSGRGGMKLISKKGNQALLMRQGGHQSDSCSSWLVPASRVLNIGDREVYATTCGSCFGVHAASGV